ncbi:nuclear transport factor 2 family protein [Streptomyces sp. NA04227]|uniref:nuclear transport factor 2 family protein n=1 Tax=Streptomyces sp. NA04227 TaxID=2742136 RepID=UPI00158F9D65|nr:nuclear transport factor 2 family protein [Streptomyces sp. NA04227]QKW07277.1 nuclear transport factor 2 family protein [Streptomyces sp. NA04227]
MTSRTDTEDVQLANTAFYEAMERGDFETLSDLWLDSPQPSPEGAAAGGEAVQVSCVHPGWPLLTGRGEVLRSYALIMANTEYIQFFLTDVQVSVLADTAVVTCTENILSGGPAPAEGSDPGPLLGQLVVATNVFRRTPDGWKLWTHHASPVLAETDDEGPEGPDAGGPGEGGDSLL